MNWCRLCLNYTNNSMTVSECEQDQPMDIICSNLNLKVSTMADTEFLRKIDDDNETKSSASSMQALWQMAKK